MAVKTPIEVKIISWFARAPEAEATRQFAIVRSLMADRGLLRKAAKAGSSTGKRARAVTPPTSVSGVADA